MSRMLYFDYSLIKLVRSAIQGMKWLIAFPGSYSVYCMIHLPAPKFNVKEKEGEND